MPTVVLVRHGRTAANATGILTGWTPGVSLDDEGERQVKTAAERLAAVPVVAVVSSPLERCQETAAALVAVNGPSGPRPVVATDERLGECRYGDWTGRELKSLVKDPLWKVVQQHASAAVFPGGETMRAMQQRALDAIRDWDARMGAEHGQDCVWVAVSHGDVIKAILADAVGSHLDQFQRIVVSPGSMSVVQYTATRPFVVRCNDVGGELASLAPKPKITRRRRARGSPSSDAALGGGG